MAFLFTFFYPRSKTTNKAVKVLESPSKRSLELSIGDLKQQPLTKKSKTSEDTDAADDISEDEEQLRIEAESTSVTGEDDFESPHEDEIALNEETALAESQSMNHLTGHGPFSWMLPLLMAFLAVSIETFSTYFRETRNSLTPITTRLAILQIWMQSLVQRLVSITMACAGG